MAEITESLKKALEIPGALAVALVDYETGMTLGTAEAMSFPIELAAAANTEVMRAKMNAKNALKLSDRIEDILITLTSQYHLIRPLGRHPNLFMYLALNRTQANLALARIKLADIESGLTI